MASNVRDFLRLTLIPPCLCDIGAPVQFQYAMGCNSQGKGELQLLQGVAQDFQEVQVDVPLHRSRHRRNDLPRALCSTRLGYTLWTGNDSNRSSRCFIDISCALSLCFEPIFDGVFLLKWIMFHVSGRWSLAGLEFLLIIDALMVAKQLDIM